MPRPEDYKAMLEDGSKMVDSATRQIEIGQRMIRFAKAQLQDTEAIEDGEKEAIIMSLKKQIDSE